MLSEELDDFEKAISNLLLREGEQGKPIELTQALKDRRPGVRELAVYLLGREKSLAVVDTLVEALKDENPRVRRLAAQSIGSIGIGGQETLDSLRQALNHDEDPLVRMEATRAVERIKKR
ncbi:MAG: HEAT repeat domain-containing protein [Candidatus Paceibacterales bacterium]